MPVFVEDKNGMTTLDFSRYFKNLRQLNFTDALLLNEKKSYSTCISNLAKIRYKDFNAKYSDLEASKGIDCAFSNYYRWSGGQEPFDSIRIKCIDLKSSVVFIEYFDKSSGSYGGNTKVHLVNQNK